MLEIGDKDKKIIYEEMLNRIDNTDLNYFYLKNKLLQMGCKQLNKKSKNYTPEEIREVMLKLYPTVKKIEKGIIDLWDKYLRFEYPDLIKERNAKETLQYINKNKSNIDKFVLAMFLLSKDEEELKELGRDFYSKYIDGTEDDEENDIDIMEDLDDEDSFFDMTISQCIQLQNEYKRIKEENLNYKKELQLYKEKYEESEKNLEKKEKEIEKLQRKITKLTDNNKETSNNIKDIKDKVDKIESTYKNELILINKNIEALEVNKVFEQNKKILKGLTNLLEETNKIYKLNNKNKSNISEEIKDFKIEWKKYLNNIKDATVVFNENNNKKEDIELDPSSMEIQINENNFEDIFDNIDNNVKDKLTIQTTKDETVKEVLDELDDIL